MSTGNNRLPLHKLTTKKQNMIIIGFTVCLSLVVIGVLSIVLK